MSRPTERLIGSVGSPGVIEDAAIVLIERVLIESFPNQEPGLFPARRRSRRAELTLLRNRLESLKSSGATRL